MKIQSVPELASFLALHTLRDARVKDFFMGTSEQWLDHQKANAQYPCVYCWMPEVDMGLDATKGKPMLSYVCTLEVHDQPADGSDRWAATAQSEDIMRTLLKRLYRLRGNGVIDRLDQPGDTNYAPFTTPDGTVGWDAQLIIGTYTGSMCAEKVRPIYALSVEPVELATSIRISIDGNTYDEPWDGDPDTLAAALYKMRTEIEGEEFANFQIWTTPNGLVMYPGTLSTLYAVNGAGLHTTTMVNSLA